MQTDDPWSLGGSPSPARTDADTPPPHTLEEALLALDHTAAPVFAVLDGAQFNNLPNDLLMGDFVSRPLYLDRGGNNPDQIITAPHMVWLDERTEKITGRAPKETIPALMALIGDRPAAVFWQCPAGAEALYRHLRGINMVMYPKAALEDWVEPEAEAGDGAPKSPPETHTLVLFRHADANVMAQLLAVLNLSEHARLFGPASSLILNADADWKTGQSELQVHPANHHPATDKRHLRISSESVAQLNQSRRERSHKRINAYLLRVIPDKLQALSETELAATTAVNIREARALGIQSEAALGRWCFLQMITGGKITEHRELTEYVSKADPEKSADERVRDLMAMAAFQASRR